MNSLGLVSLSGAAIIILAGLLLLWNYRKIDRYLLRQFYSSRLRPESKELLDMMRQLQGAELESRLRVIQSLTGNYEVSLLVEGDQAIIQTITASRDLPPPEKKDRLAQ